MERPTRASDLSQMEHVWDILRQRIREQHNVNSVADLSRVLQQELNHITLHELRMVIDEWDVNIWL
jgi:hypothetical protein